MFGYATDETEECMPLTIVLAHKLNAKMAELRRDGTIPWLRPDSKTQVSRIRVENEILWLEEKPTRLWSYFYTLAITNWYNWVFRATMCRFKAPGWHWPCYLISQVFIEPTHWPIGVTAVEQDSDHEAVSFNAWEKMTPSMTSRAPGPSQWDRGHGCAPVNLRSMPATQAGQLSGSWNLWSILEFCHFQTIQQEMSFTLRMSIEIMTSDVVLYVIHNSRSLCTTSRRMALWFLCVSTQ